MPTIVEVLRELAAASAQEPACPPLSPTPNMNDQRANWAEAALRHYAVQVSGPHAFEDMCNADEVVANVLCDLAHLADERGWRLVDLLRIARSRYELETESQGEQFDNFEQLV